MTNTKEFLERWGRTWTTACYIRDYDIYGNYGHYMPVFDIYDYSNTDVLNVGLEI